MTESKNTIEIVKMKEKMTFECRACDEEGSPCVLSHGGGDIPSQCPLNLGVVPAWHVKSQPCGDKKMLVRTMIELLEKCNENSEVRFTVEQTRHLSSGRIIRGSVMGVVPRPNKVVLLLKKGFLVFRVLMDLSYAHLTSTVSRPASTL